MRKIVDFIALFIVADKNSHPAVAKMVENNTDNALHEWASRLMEEERI